MIARDPLLSPPPMPWGAILFIGLDAGLVLGLAVGAFAGPGWGLMAGAMGFALATGYLALRLVGPWSAIHIEFLLRDLDRRSAPPREVVIRSERPEPTRILNGTVRVGEADAVEPDGDRPIRELLVGLIRAAQVNGWGIRDLVGLRIRTSAGEIPITDPLWRAATDLLAERGFLRKTPAGSIPLQDPEVLVAWARSGRLGPEIRRRLGAYLAAPSLSPAGDGEGDGRV
jgi:hypothetical protein